MKDKNTAGKVKIASGFQNTINFAIKDRVIHHKWEEVVQMVWAISFAFILIFKSIIMVGGFPYMTLKISDIWHFEGQDVEVVGT